MKVQSLSHTARTILLARVAHNLTVSARSTYEPGTDNILEPKVLRGYNELLHRVTSAIRFHTEGTEEISIEAVIEMMREFGKTYDCEKEMEWVLQFSQSLPLPVSH